MMMHCHHLSLLKLAFLSRSCYQILFQTLTQVWIQHYLLHWHPNVHSNMKLNILMICGGLSGKEKKIRSRIVETNLKTFSISLQLQGVFTTTFTLLEYA